MTLRARALRHAMTDAERRLWSRLRGDALGVRVRRQLVIDRRWIADFCIPELRLIVEVDGGQHGESPSDDHRTDGLECAGYHVLRFWNGDVLRETDWVVEAILAAIRTRRDELASPLSPLRNGEGKHPVGSVFPGPVPETSDPKACS